MIGGWDITMILDVEYMGKVLEVQMNLLRDGREPNVVLPSDLERVGIPAWPGRLFGMVCEPSPVVRT